uniref:uncharacterized protein LOC120336279 isoform X2 n=1 Tax=Styela clava TaxID=7725 RepID=UPI00193A3BCD|nr:uncharacterized protein LOC120336279 isoform X2 [Styela clava]
MIIFFKSRYCIFILNYTTPISNFPFFIVSQYFIMDVSSIADATNNLIVYLATIIEIAHYTLVIYGVRNDWALPQIENVSSQRSGSDILLTWNAVSDRNVLYNIEIFCDDVKLGETHTAEVPQYRMKSPTLGKTYCFQVWAKDEWGNSGIKTQSKNVIKGAK